QSFPGSALLGAQLLAVVVDRHQTAVALDMPEGPAVACRGPLHLGADKMDRAAGLGRNHAAVGAYPRRPTPALGEQTVARPQQPALDQRAKRHARCLAL